MEFKDYYATLGVPKTASAKEVKQAFRKMARKYHPDVNPGDKSAESRFKEINEAYEVIGDPEKRKKYDELGSNWKMYEQAQRGGGGAGAGGFDPGQWNANFGGGGGGGTGQLSHDDARRDARSLRQRRSVLRFLSCVLLRRRRAADARPRRARGISRVEPAHRDATSSIRLICRSRMPIRGTTRRLSLQHDGQSRNVDVRIPAGVGEGSRVRVSGEGEQGAGGAGSGDLYLRIHMTPDSRFERKGQDLHAKVRVPVTTAVLGGEAEVPNPAESRFGCAFLPARRTGRCFV